MQRKILGKKKMEEWFDRQFPALPAGSPPSRHQPTFNMFTRILEFHPWLHQDHALSFTYPAPYYCCCSAISLAHTDRGWTPRRTQAKQRDHPQASKQSSKQASKQATTHAEDPHRRSTQTLHRGRRDFCPAKTQPQPNLNLRNY